MSFWMSHAHPDCLGRWKLRFSRPFCGKRVLGYLCPECNRFHHHCPESESAVHNFTLSDRDLIEARHRFEETWKPKS